MEKGMQSIQGNGLIILGPIKVYIDASLMEQDHPNFRIVGG